TSAATRLPYSSCLSSRSGGGERGNDGVGRCDPAKDTALRLDHAQPHLLKLREIRADAIGDDDAVVAAVVCFAHRRIDTDLGGNPADDQLGDAAVLQHRVEVGGVKCALARLVDDGFARPRVQFGDDVMSGLAAHQDAAHRTRVADAGGKPASRLLRRRQIRKVGAMTLAGVDDGQRRASCAVEEASGRRNGPAQQRNVVAECRAEPTGLEEIALHVDDHEARPRRIEIDRVRFGVDSGGTFTDVCLFDQASGRIAVWKVSSTPADPAHAVIEGVSEALAQIPAQASDVTYFGHGTTVATNALIQHRGAPTGLITSDGFRDLLEIGRQRRPDLYDLQADKPPVLVERALRLEVPERLRHDGRVETALDEVAVRTAVRRLRAAGVEAVAACFLYSFLDPAHEAAACRIVSEEFPEAFACASHEVAPEFREYERLSTTVVNAYLGPVIARYIGGVADRLAALGVTARPHLTQSNGGVIGFDTAARLPVRTVL